MRLCISIASILFVTTPAVATTITVRPETPDRPIVVVVEGSLAAFDEDQFAAKTAPLSSAFVAFSSDGGSLVAGLRIGEAIRRKRFSTIVPDGRRCASACALAWLGGVERFIGTSGKISFHAAYDAASDESGVGTAVVDDLSRPGGNLTGFNLIAGPLPAKQLGLLHELVPAAKTIAVLINPNNANAEARCGNRAGRRARDRGAKILVMRAAVESDFETVFATIARERAGALLANSDVFFTSRRDQINRGELSRHVARIS